jgi:adenylate cyclase
LLSIAAGTIGVVLALTPFGSAFEDQLGLQLLYSVRGPIEVPPQVVVVSIDKRSADRLGLPPNPRNWPRETHARLIDELVRRDASVIVFDVDMSEPRDDEALAAAIARARRVVLVQRIDVEKFPIGQQSSRPAGEIVHERIVFPVDSMRVGAMGLGPFPLPKVPARVDQFWAFKSAAGEMWPTLPAVALQLYALPALEQFLAHIDRAGFQWPDGPPPVLADVKNERDVRRLMRSLRLGFVQDSNASERFLASLSERGDENLSVDVRKTLATLAKLYGGDDGYRMNFYGPPGTIRTIPYFAVLNDSGTSGQESQIDLSGKVVFVGASELSIVDRKDSFYTVFSRDDGVDLSGVEIAASAFANLLTNRALRHFGSLTTFTIIVVFGGLVGILAYRLPGMRAVASTLGVGVAYFGSAQFLFAAHNQVVPVVVPLFFQLPLTLLMGLFVQYLGASREREIVSRAIRHYVPENVAESLEKRGVAPESSELVYGTCLRTDAEHYTTLSEDMEPQELASLMNCAPA